MPPRRKNNKGDVEAKVNLLEADLNALKITVGGNWGKDESSGMEDEGGLKKKIVSLKKSSMGKRIIRFKNEEVERTKIVDWAK
ncbi:unnamed protein product [Sphenostylis stenocarpa]|uniref:Uncharacterized protein n=1 Tax=Sphenostylis stenocarpa TaxID=92480 RepID=A0AA86STN4_9FABA|nr:unnamed protein product [Sphenostylis stenocarpa]